MIKQYRKNRSYENNEKLLERDRMKTYQPPDAKEGKQY